MSEGGKRPYFITTAIDYPNSRPHIGTAFEKLGADAQARYRRMEGHTVRLLMGNDENTLKVSSRAAELGQDTRAYCDEMAKQFREVWDALDISYDVFVQTSSERHHACCKKFIQKVFDAGHIAESKYEGWYCPGCEEFKSDKVHEAQNGRCPNHPNTLLTRRSEPCYVFKLSAFSDRLLAYYEEHPEFIQPESRRNEIIGLIKTDGLHDLNITRLGEEWGVRAPFDEKFTIYVWFDALLTYITGIGYGDDEREFAEWWPAEVHVIGKDITRFHAAIWPAMLWAAGLEIPKMVFGHGFVYVDGVKESKTSKDRIEPMDIVAKYGSDAFRYYFLRECPYPSDGEYSTDRFVELFDSELANNFGNMYSRITKLVSSNFDKVLSNTAGVVPPPVDASADRVALVAEIRGHVEAFEYHQALAKIVQKILTPANQYLESNAPWKLVKSDLDAARVVLFTATEALRTASILLKPFLTKGAATIYNSFNFAKPWDEVCYADAAEPGVFAEDMRLLAETDAKGGVTPLYMRIGGKK